MTNQRRWLTVLLAVLVVSVAAWLFFSRAPAHSVSPGPVLTATPDVAAGFDAGVVLLTLRAPPRSAALADEPPGNVIVDGLVIDEHDAPVRDAVVFIDSRPQRQARTDARGEWRFEGLAPREYTLVAVRDTLSAGPVTGRFLARQDPVVLRLVHPPRRLSVTVIDEQTNERIPGVRIEAQGLTRSEATTNSVGEANGILVDGVDPVVMLSVKAAGYTPLAAEVTLSPEGGTCLLGLSRGGPVAVRVTAAAGGRPVEKARVTLYSERLSALDPGARVSAETEPAGWARFDAIAPGRWHVEVEHPDYENFSTSRALARGAVVEVQLTQGISVRGRVLHADGAPAAKASVNSSSPWRWATCDEQGRFSIRGLRAGRQLLDARLGPATAPRLELDLAEGAPVPDVTLTLNGRGVISGMVVGPDRKGVKAQVSATSVDGTQFATAVAGKDGLFEFTNLDPVPTWTLRADRTVYLGSNPNRFSSSESEPRTARVGDVSVVLEVPLSAAVRGRVSFSDGSAPASFKVEVGPRPKQEVSGSDGAFEVVDVKAGRVLFQVTGPDFLPHEAMVQLPPGVVTDLGTIVVSRGRTLRGKVMNGTWPVPGATIWVSGRGDDGRALNPLTRSDGTFELPFLQLGATFVTARHPTLGRARARAIPAGTEDVEVDLALEKTTILSGRLLRGGLPLAAWPVEVRHLGDPLMGGGRQTGSDGRFVIPDLVPGRWSISVPSKTFLFMNRQWVVLPSPVDVLNDELDVGDLIVPLGKTLQLSAREAGMVLISSEVVPALLVGHRELALRLLGERGGEWRYVWMPNTTREVKDLLPGRVWVCRIIKPNGTVRVDDDLGVESCASLVVDDSPVQEFTLP